MSTVGILLGTGPTGSSRASIMEALPQPPLLAPRPRRPQDNDSTDGDPSGSPKTASVTPSGSWEYLSDEGGNRPPLKDPNLIAPDLAVLRHRNSKTFRKAVPLSAVNPTDLLHMLSLPGKRIDSFELSLESIIGHASVRYDEVLFHLFGAGNRQMDELEKYPDSRHLGQFPLFVDSAGREYFDYIMPIRCKTNPEAFNLMVRIPAHLTRRLCIPGRQASYGDTLELPAPGEILVLRPARTPFFPFWYDSRSSTIMRSVDPFDLTMRNNSPRLVRLTGHVHSQDWDEPPRKASCLVNVVPDDMSTFQYNIDTLIVMRHAYYTNVVNCFLAMFRSDHDPDHMLDFISVLQGTWLPDLKEAWSSSKSGRDSPRSPKSLTPPGSSGRTSRNSGSITPGSKTPTLEQSAASK